MMMMSNARTWVFLFDKEPQVYKANIHYGGNNFHTIVQMFTL
jgi:hypothetical protein